jgi:PAS domain S-box-containing protein
MKKAPATPDGLRGSASAAIALQSAWTLSALIFLISSIYEVLSTNHLYQSQQFLIGLLLVVFSLWALLEVLRISQRPGSPPLRTLVGLLTVQLTLISARHWHADQLRTDIPSLSGPPAVMPAFGETMAFLPIYFFTFLAISRCLISAFSHAESIRARELHQQMEILKATKTALEISERRYRTFFNIPVVGTAITSSSRAWIEVNDETCRLLGYSREELLTRTWSELTHPDDLAVEERQFQRLLRREIDSYELEKRFIRKDRTVGYTLVAGGCGPIDDQAVDLCYMNLIDISARKRFEAELEAAQERERLREEQQRGLLEQKLKTSLTAAAVAHEIQQPLAAILLKCRLAAQDLAAMPPADATAVLQERLSSLTADAELVVTTVERMRMLLRNVETIHSCVDLSAILRSALIFLRSEIETQQVQLSDAGLEQASTLQGDSAQLQMAVVNLVRNALQAMENQRPSTRRIRVELQHQSGQLNVVVADSGPGFPPDHRSDTSWELLKSSKATGMGLGLFLAQTAATNHGGRLRVGRSATLGGAEVVLELPLNVG